jgi:hypothetical protein
MSWRTLARWLVAAAVLLGLVLLLPVLWMKTVDEAGVPSGVPPLPAGVTVVGEDLLCGSGGCYRVLRLRGPVEGSADGWPDGVGPQHQVCRAAGLLDRRQVCSHLEDWGKGVALVVQYDRDAWF